MESVESKIRKKKLDSIISLAEFSYFLATEMSSGEIWIKIEKRTKIEGEKSIKLIL